MYIQKLLLFVNRAERMKGICHIWSRSRHFSPSLPGDRYLNLGSKSDHRAELGEHRLVRRSGATSRGTALVFCSLCKRCVLDTRFCAGLSFQELIYSTPFEKLNNANFPLFCHFWFFAQNNPNMVLESLLTWF